MLLAYYIVINHSRWYHRVTSDSWNHENQQVGGGGGGGGGGEGGAKVPDPYIVGRW